MKQKTIWWVSLCFVLSVVAVHSEAVSDSELLASQLDTLQLKLQLLTTRVAVNHVQIEQVQTELREVKRGIEWIRWSILGLYVFLIFGMILLIRRGHNEKQTH